VICDALNFLKNASKNASVKPSDNPLLYANDPNISMHVCCYGGFLMRALVLCLIQLCINQMSCHQLLMFRLCVLLMNEPFVITLIRFMRLYCLFFLIVYREIVKRLLSSRFGWRKCIIIHISRTEVF